MERVSGGNPLVSVIMPAYNHEKYVQEAVRSIIGQTYGNIELIILDDGSEDATFARILELEEECRARFVNVRILRQQNSGVCATLNRLCSLASGDYVYVIASDDVAEADAVGTLLECFDRDDVVLAVGDNSIIDDVSNAIGWGPDRELDGGEVVFYSWWKYNCYRRPKLETLGDSFGSYESLLGGCYLTNGVLIRRAALVRTGGYRDGALDDWYIQLQLAKLGRFRFVDRALYRYRWHGANTAKDGMKMKELIAATKKYEEENVISSGDGGLLKRFYENIDFSSEFYTALDAVVDRREFGRVEEVRTYYKKLRRPSARQSFFYIISFVPPAVALLRLRRRMKLGRLPAC